MAVSINCDLGEAFGIWRLGDDEGCMPFIHTQTLPADITHPIPAPCALVSWPAARRSRRRSSGLPDRKVWPARNEALAREVTALVLYQVGALDAFVRAENMRMVLKPPER
jgi:UPF0271 protein